MSSFLSVMSVKGKNLMHTGKRFDMSGLESKHKFSFAS